MVRLKRFLSFFIFLFFLVSVASAQSDRWQQRVYYNMEIHFDVKNHRFSGKQRLVYSNNSPDDLDQVFYHLYFNAFQPGSSMDVRSRTIKGGGDPRVKDRISKLKEDEIGYHQIKSLCQNGHPVEFEVVGTILEVRLHEPVPAGGSAVFDLEFESQVPVQIRRSGRDNAEGIAYSMAQWYPKMCEYDYQGWHANPYISREFYGVWGDFDVKITIDKDYLIGGTGYLQNPEEIGFGYGEKTEKNGKKEKTLTWHFFAPNVHDFVWAADPDYTHDTFTRKDGMVLHFFYQKNDKTEDAWSKLPPIMDRAFEFINRTFGQYPYKQYAFIQAGDGGMEYPMATLITGNRPLPSLVGVSVHELMHSWYQMVLGSNESLYPWMDEGFTSFATDETQNFLRKEGLIPGEYKTNPHQGTVQGYINFARSGQEEPMSTHADHFVTNQAYGVSAYTKGALFLVELQYILGKKAFDAGMLRYFDTWKFKHPNANDFIRIMEKQSRLELDWYKEYRVNTLHVVDYAIESVTDNSGKAVVKLRRTGGMPMPLDIKITYTDGSQEIFNIPLDIMRGNKPGEEDGVKFTVLPDWPWTHPEYEMIPGAEATRIQKIEIDPSGRMADINVKDNMWQR